ncbi:MAG: universal stress protein [Leptolyngbyaceae cyanobacterium]
MFKTVLFPIDMSPEAQQAATLAADLVKQHHSQLVLLSVVEAKEQADHPQQSSTQAVAALLNQAQAMFEQQGIASKILEREGQPAFVICDVADEIEADLIIMGCRGIGLIEDAVQESVTNRVINLSPCPVLVVP